MHLLVDGYTSDNDLLKDARKISGLLNAIPGEIGMTQISEPIVTEYLDEASSTDWGLSGFVLIAESHISIHTFPERDYVNVDVFSCKEFDHIKSAKKIGGIKTIVLTDDKDGPAKHFCDEFKYTRHKTYRGMLEDTII